MEINDKENMGKYSTGNAEELNSAKIKGGIKMMENGVMTAELVRDELVTNTEEQHSIVQQGIDANNEILSQEEKDKAYSAITKAQADSFVSVSEEDFDNDPHNEIMSKDIELIKKKGAFIPLENMTLIAKGTEGTHVFARRIAKGGGLGDPALTFLYPDGSISEDISISMFELYEIAAGNFGVNCADKDQDQIKSAKRLIKKFGSQVMSYWSSDLNLRAVELIEILLKNLGHLKVDNRNELDISKIYLTIYKYIQKVEGYPHKGYIKRKSVYALMPEDMEEIATTLLISVKELVVTLKKYNVLHLQPSSVGYQCEVKGVGSCYCIKVFEKYKHDDYADFSGDAYALL